MLAVIIFTVFIIFTFFMASVFKAKELKARKNNSGADTFCCGKCGACDKDLPADS